MPDYTLPRTGRLPLTFRGAEIASVAGRWHAGREQNRWHDLTLYRTEGGTIVLRIEYRTCWQGELEREDAWIIPTGAELAAMLSERLSSYASDLSTYVGGFPRRPDYAHKQAALLADLSARYLDRVSQLLAALPEAAETVP